MERLRLFSGVALAVAAEFDARPLTGKPSLRGCTTYWKDRRMRSR